MVLTVEDVIGASHMTPAELLLLLFEPATSDVHFEAEKRVAKET